jgi:hypothetical protein
MAERGSRPGPGESDPTVADAAAQACHDDRTEVPEGLAPSR